RAAGEWAQVFVDPGDRLGWIVWVWSGPKEQWNAIWIEVDRAKTCKVGVGRLLLEHIPSFLPKRFPREMVFLGIALVVLGDIEGFGIDLFRGKPGRVVSGFLGAFGFVAVDDVVVGNVCTHGGCSIRSFGGFEADDLLYCM